MDNKINVFPLYYEYVCGGMCSADGCTGHEDKEYIVGMYINGVSLFTQNDHEGNGRNKEAWEDSKLLREWDLEFAKMLSDKNTADFLLEDNQKWIKKAWEHLRPKHGETWIKDSCSNPLCRIGWSLGVGTYIIDENKNLDWGRLDAIVCGCLHKK